MKYIDIHGHMNFSAYEADRDEIIKKALDNGVAIITVGTQYDTSVSALELAKKYEQMYAIVGLHPVHTNDSYHDILESGKKVIAEKEELDITKYLDLAKDNKVVAIGEVGLDYYHLEENDRVGQIEVLESMIDIANRVDKPLMLHIRNGLGRSAYKDAYEIIKDKAKVGGNLHFFAGNIDEAKIFLDLGYTFSFTGVITFARNYDEVIKYLPLDRIMSETDCPYVSPVPYRGKRNEPIHVIEVVKTIAKIKNLDLPVVEKQIMDNAKKYFKISL